MFIVILDQELRKEINESLEEFKMGKNNPGERDGTGPAEGSYQAEHSDEGQRAEAGEPCPEKSE